MHIFTLSHVPQADMTVKDSGHHRARACVCSSMSQMLNVIPQGFVSHLSNTIACDYCFVPPVQLHTSDSICISPIKSDPSVSSTL